MRNTGKRLIWQHPSEACRSSRADGDLNFVDFRAAVFKEPEHPCYMASLLCGKPERR